MTDSISFTVLAIPPSRNHYVRISKRGGYKTQQAKAFEKEIWAVGVGARNRANMPRFINCRVEIVLHFWEGFAGPQVDIDNAPKLVLDGLRNCGFYEDDNAVREMEVKLRESAGTPRTEITVRKLERGGVNG